MTGIAMAILQFVKSGTASQELSGDGTVFGDERLYDFLEISGTPRCDRHPDENRQRDGPRFHCDAGKL